MGEGANPLGYMPTPTLAPQYRGPAETLSEGGAASASGVGLSSGSEFIAIPSAGYVGGSAKLPFEVINLRYDLTPIGNISMVATEAGLIPPTSVPVLIREIGSDFGAAR
jgi:translation initiation factor 2B subunit (eIF-2B alpha/beta/delta family)